MQEQNKDLRLTVDKLRLQVSILIHMTHTHLVRALMMRWCMCLQLDSLRGQQQQQVDGREKELATLRGSLRDLHKDLAEKTRLLQRKTRLGYHHIPVIIVVKTLSLCERYR